MSESTVERPSSMSAALESAEASAASDPSPSSEPAESSAPVASEPAAATSGDATVSTGKPEPGPIPYARFREVNEAKGKLEKDIEALAWARGISPQQVRELYQWHQRATGDPSSFLQEYLANAPADRQAAIRSEAARILAGMRGAQPQADPEPAPDLQTEVGPMRSPKNQAEWLAWNQRQLEAKFDQKLTPLQQQLSTYQQREQAAVRLQGIAQFTSAQASEAKSWPKFDAYKAEIAEVYKNAPQPDPNWSDREQAFFEAQQLRTAYITVLAKHQGDEQAAAAASVLTDLNQRANARTEHPARSGGTAPKKPASMLESLERAAAGR